MFFTDRTTKQNGKGQTICLWSETRLDSERWNDEITPWISKSSDWGIMVLVEEVI
jgi:hypothetical protein